MPEQKKIYQEDAIKTLDTITAIRLRPAMYIDGIGEMGLYKIDSEIVQNAFDEFLIGEATFCKIDYDSEKGLMTVEDDGRGIPIGKLEDVFTKAHTGGKFDRESYQISSGQNGIGAKAANALSTYCACEVWRAGYTDEKGNWVKPRYGYIEFKNGRKVSEFSNDLPDNSTKHGTKVFYITDDSIMKTSKRNIQRFRDYLNTISYIDTGILIEYTVDGVKETFQHFGGIPEFYSTTVKQKKIKTVVGPIAFNGVEDMFSYEIIFGYGPNNTGDSNIYSFVNGNRTPNHGTHVSGFRAGCALALTQYINDNDLVPKNLKGITISGTLISDNIVGIVSVRHRDPLYTGQTKGGLSSEEVYEPIKQCARQTLYKFMKDNQQAAKKLVDLVLDYAKYELERKKLKENMLKTRETKSAFDANGVDSKKFLNCRCTNPEERELFIVEGDSAGNNFKACLSPNQALYMLTGKILNVVRSPSNISSKVILDFIQILKMGMPNARKVDKCDFHKILITTDADDDGAHIVTLLIAFFYACYPEVIENGWLYVSQPPIKKIELDEDRCFYIHTEDDFQRLMNEYIVNTFELYSEKSHKKLSEGAFKFLMNMSQNYIDLLNIHSNNLIIEPRLLEWIVVYINDLMKGNYKVFESHGYSVKRINSKVFEFDFGIRHYMISIDKSFIDGAYAEIYRELQKIGYYGFYFKGIRSKKEYHGSWYDLCKLSKDILGPKVRIVRNKGLGEMDEVDLYETVINPRTRRTTRVTMDDAAKAKFAIDTFMGVENPDFKQKFYAGIEKFE